jgi:hypothetical protein
LAFTIMEGRKAEQSMIREEGIGIPVMIQPTATA